MVRIRVFMVAGVILISLLKCLEVEAYTTNDMREMLGRYRNDEEGYKDTVNTIVNNYNSIKQNNLLVEQVNSGKIKEINEAKLVDAKNKLVAVEQLLEASMSNMSSLEDVFKIVDSSELAYTEVQNCISLNETVLNIEYKENTYEEDMKYANSMLDSIGDNVDIGGLCDELRKPLKYEKFNVVSVADNIYLADDSVEVRDSLILGGSPYEKTEVISQWSGVVGKVKKIKNGTYTVKIQHSKALYSTYSNLLDVVVKAGEAVNHYDTVGIIDIASALELKIVLDSKTVNPMLLYGHNGVNALKDWISSNPGKLVEDVDLDSIRVGKFISEHTDDITSEDISSDAMPDWYTKPKNTLVTE